MRAITAVLERARHGPGEIVLLEGAAGEGKTLLVGEALQRVEEAATGQATRVAIGQCYESGMQNALQPFAEVVEAVEGAGGARAGLLSVAGTVAKKTAPDWLHILPVVGAFLSAGAKTLSAGAEALAARAGAESEGLARRWARVLKRTAERAPLIVVIEDAHWMDAASGDLLLRLAAELPRLRLAFVLTYRAAEAEQNDAFDKVRAHLVGRAGAHTVTIGGLAEQDVALYLQRRFRTTFFAAFPRWLLHLCDGHPLFVTQYLNLLEEEGIIVSRGGDYSINGGAELLEGEWRLSGQLADLPISHDLGTLLDQRIRRLEDEEREMLQLAAVQGPHFGSLVLARVFEQKERTVLARLRQVSERHRIVGLYTGTDWLRERSEVYAFEHVLMQQAFYRKLGPHERLLYHREVADVLQPLVAEYEHPPRRLLLDVARHRRCSRQWLEAAAHYHAAAGSSYLDGATAEAMQLCEEAAACLAELPADDGARDRLEATAALLQLVSSMYGPIDAATNRRLLVRAAAGAAAAERARDQSRLAEIRAATGQLHIRAGDVPAAIAVMRRAVEETQASGDARTHFFALLQLGKQLAKQDLAESLAVRYAALALFNKLIAGPDAGDAHQRALLARQGANLQIYLGVGELDAGDYDRAIAALEQGVAELRALHMHDDVVAGMNYLAQAYAAIGRLADAERALRDSLDAQPERDPEAPYPWIGYNLGLLAKVLLDDGRVVEAEPVMREAVRISEAARQIDLLTIVRNYQGELLAHPGHPHRDVAAAEAVLRTNLAESDDAGLTRSAVLARVLLARLAHARGDRAEAEVQAANAVAAVELHGDMPALRTEEVYFTHYLVLRDADPPRVEARRSLARAHEVLEAKAARLTAPRSRAGFRALPLAREITAALDAR